MKNKLFYLSFGILFLLILTNFISAGDAASNLTATNVSICVRQKVCDNILNGNTIINITFDASYLNQNWTSANIYIKSASKTANTSLILINDSADKGQSINNSNNMTLSISSLRVEDGDDYTITIALWNGTGGTFARFNITQAVTVDNGVPLITDVLPASGTTITTSETRTFSATIPDKNMTSCSYNINRAGNLLDALSGSGTCSCTGDTCSFTKAFTSTSANGIYDYTFTATDDSNTTVSTSQTFISQLSGAGSGSGGNSGIDKLTTNKSSPILLFIVGGIIIVAVIVGAVVAFKPSHKKRK